MRSAIVAATLLVCNPLSIITAAAQETCFCLRHADGARLRGCTSFKGSQDFYATAVCTDPETGRSSEQTITSDWQRIAEGADGCSPCQSAAERSTDYLPRKPAPTPP